MGNDPCDFIHEDGEQNFANHPPTIGDKRSDKTGKAKDWSVRDALIKTLHEIDSGKITARKIVMIINIDKDGPLKPGECPIETMTRQAGTQTVYETYGMLAWAQHIIAMK